MIKKIIFFILILLLISSLFFVGCLFYGPCKTKIVKYIPDNYKSYLSLKNTDEIKNKNNSSSGGINDFGVDETPEADITDGMEEKENENNLKNEEEKVNKNNSDENDFEINSEEKSEGENKEEKTNKNNSNENDSEINSEEKSEGENKEEKTYKEKVENKIEKLEKKIDNDEINEKKRRKEEIIKRLKARKEKSKNSNPQNTDNKKKSTTKKMSFVTYVDGKKKILEVEKFLGNGVYYTSDSEIYIKSKKITSTDNINNFKVKKIGENIALLTEKKGAYKKVFFIDIQKKDFYIYKETKVEITKAKKINNKIIFLIKSNYKEGGIFSFNIKTKKVEKIFSNSDNSIKKDSFSYKKTINFNILNGNAGNILIEVIYKGQNNKELRKISEITN